MAAISASKPPPPPAATQSVKCDSCGFTEECTLPYIHRVRDLYNGRWICGLCVEAVKDEVRRSDAAISTEEALDRHISFCEKFRTSSPTTEIEHPFIAAFTKILRRRRAHRSISSGSLPYIESVKGTSGLVRSESCFPALSR